MPLVSLQSARKKTVGAKQTIKAIDKGLAKRVYVAMDAETRVTDPIVALCRGKGVDVVSVDTMKNLGKACNIEVGCAVAAMLE